MIVEMAGRPAEHVKESLAKHIGILDEVKDIEVHSIKISEPKEIENSEGMFTCFVEADFETENFSRLSETMFDFMPSSVEVIEPPNITMSLADATNLLNNISGRLHRYDELANVAGARLQQMGEQLQAAQQALAERDKKVVGEGDIRQGEVRKKKGVGKKNTKKVGEGKVLRKRGGKGKNS